LRQIKNILFGLNTISLLKTARPNCLITGVVTGYGEQETGVFQGDEAFKRAIRIALRDTGANLSIKTQGEIENITNMIG
jgi:hypothetical protein